MPYSTAPNIKIFLSYAHEDQTIADAIASMLRQAFFSTIEITMMSEFPLGVNWQQLIVDSAENTDIMIAIATGRLKPAQSFTGYEIGCFMASKSSRRNMKIATDLERRMIPFAVIEKTPSVISDYEGVGINPDDLHAVRFDATRVLSENEDLSADDSDEATQGVVKFLGNLQNIVSAAVPGTDTTIVGSRDRLAFFNTLAPVFCRQIFSDIGNRERNVIIPKSTLIIRVQPSTQPGVDVLAKATVQTQGPSDDSFGLHEEKTFDDWDSFLKCAASEDISYMWNEAFRSLLVSLNTDDFVENNTILSYDRKKTFRAFVGRLTTLYSGVREYQIFVIPLLRPKDYGDPKTTVLLKELQVSLAYRFMFLEGSSSPFSPDIIRATQLGDLPSTVSAMQSALNMLLQIAEDGGLDNPAQVVSILGVNGIENVYASWDNEKKNLYDSASKILTGPVDANVKAAFVAQLTTFCEHTQDLNKRYTAGVMDELQKRIAETS
jgi:hypothetical protein